MFEKIYSKAENYNESQPALKFIRKHFIGRVIHSNSEQWRRDVDDIIQFNSSEASDAETWKRK